MHNDTNANAKSNVHSIQSSFFHGGLYSGDDGQGVTGERALWRAVITQALMDISSNSKMVIDKVERARALAWFSIRNPDFLSVCSMADMDPKYVLKKVKESIARGGKWRKEPGQHKNGQTVKPKKRKLSKNNPVKYEISDAVAVQLFA